MQLFDWTHLSYHHVLFLVGLALMLVGFLFFYLPPTRVKSFAGQVGGLGGALTGGNLGAMPFTELKRTWGPEPHTRARDVLRLHAHNLARVVVHLARARLSCHPGLNVTTDGPLTLELAGCGRTLQFDSP